MRFQHDLAGETIGTFILVFFGCGSVAATVLFSSHVGLFQVAAIWGSGVALAIYATRHLSCAHLNPAVSIAMAVGGRMNPEKLPTYLAGQFMGAALAALTLYGLFASAITEFELMHGIVRGTPNSVQTAMIFGEFFPNPGLGQKVSVSLLNAFGAEAVGTFILVFFIMALTEGCNIGRPDDALAPMFIGLTVAIIICILAPLTQAGLNPARDLAPRLVACLAGWGRAAFPEPFHGFVTVYVLGPISGGVLSSLVFTGVIQKLMANKPKNQCACTKP